MPHIPLEILDTIIKYVEVTKDNRLSLYSPVSKYWQTAVERVTFNSLDLSNSDLNNFHEVFQGEKCSRRYHLRRIYLRCMLPNYTRPESCCHLTKKFDPEADSTIWSDFLQRVFLILEDINHTIQENSQNWKLPAISLLFREISRRKRGRGIPYLSHIGTSCSTHSKREIEAGRAQPGTIKLYNSQFLPSLSFVSSITGHCYGGSKYLHPNWISRLADKLPQLREVSLIIEDAYDWGSNWRKQYQSDLFQAFCSLPPATLETMCLKVHTHEIRNENVPVQQLCTSGEHMYNRLLRHLSTFTQLRILFLTGPITVTPTLFDIQNNSANIFPCLEEFSLEFTPQTANGKWFFLRDDIAFDNRTPDQIEEDEELSDSDGEGEKWIIYTETQVRVGKISKWRKFRSLPNPETFTPFLSSAAGLCGRIPRIKQFSLKLNNDDLNRGREYRLDYTAVDRVFELWFFTAGTSSDKPNGTIGKPTIRPDVSLTNHNRVYFRVGNYKPDSTILNSWREVIGKDGKMNFLDEEHVERRW